MKTRIENFIKVTRERVLRDIEKSNPYEFNPYRANLQDMYDKLHSILKRKGETELVTMLTTEWDNIWLDLAIDKWDEDFLMLIANEGEGISLLDEVVSSFGSAPRKAQGQAVAYSTAQTQLEALQKAYQDNQLRIQKELMTQHYKTHEDYANSNP